MTYQGKRSKSVNILNTLHPYVTIREEGNPKKNSNTILLYNSTKNGVNVLDQMSRCYSEKSAIRGWPMHVFYNVLDLVSSTAEFFIKR